MFSYEKTLKRVVIMTEGDIAVMNKMLPYGRPISNPLDYSLHPNESPQWNYASNGTKKNSTIFVLTAQIRRVNFNASSSPQLFIWFNMKENCK